MASRKRAGDESLILPVGGYDYVKCLYPTPWPGSRDMEFQTKNAYTQSLDTYEVREDGTLWHEEYHARLVRSEDSPLGVAMCRDNRKFVPESDFTGQLEIYSDRYTIIFWFRNGKARDAVFYEDANEIEREC